MFFYDLLIFLYTFRKSFTKEEINELLEEGRFYLACQLMNNDQNEEAIEAFKKLHTPYASFYQAMVSTELSFFNLKLIKSNNNNNNNMLRFIKN